MPPDIAPFLNAEGVRIYSQRDVTPARHIQEMPTAAVLWLREVHAIQKARGVAFHVAVSILKASLHRARKVLPRPQPDR